MAEVNEIQRKSPSERQKGEWKSKDPAKPILEKEVPPDDFHEIGGVVTFIDL